MSLRSLPAVQAFTRPAGLQWDAPSDVLARWSSSVPLAAEDDPATITIYDVIGEDWWTGGGFTAARAAGILRSIGPKPVTVKLNSPGGDMFEGVAIYNLLREHPARVSIDVHGLAASAASIIAMAGDDIRMGLGSFMMIHNAWGTVIGNRHEMRAVADLFEGFDAAMVDIYAARTDRARDEIVAAMDSETYMGAREAVEQGFADSVRDDDAAPAARAALPQEISARRRADAMLAQAGMPRSERRRLLKEIAGMQDAAGQAMPGAGPDTAALRRLIDTIRSF